MAVQVGPIVPGLLPPVVAKLVGSESSPLLSNLLLVIAQLVHLNATQLVECLAKQPSPGAEPCLVICLSNKHGVTSMPLLLMTVNHSCPCRMLA